MLHHLLARLLVWSANMRVQLCPSHALTLAKSSSHTNLANASAIGASSDSGDRQRRVARSSRRPPSPPEMRLNVSSRSNSRLRGPSSRSASGASGRPICRRTKALNHSRKAASLGGDLVQFRRRRSRAQRIQRIRWNELGLSQPVEEALAVIKPVDRRIDGRRDRVQEIEAERIGNEICGRPAAERLTLRIRLTCPTTVDKLFSLS